MAASPLSTITTRPSYVINIDIQVTQVQYLVRNQTILLVGNILCVFIVVIIIVLQSS
jgi:hypothetical protein